MIEKQSKSNKCGKREGAGRKAGSRNIKTRQVLEAVEATGITPLAYMLSVMRDEGAESKDRMSAAAAAAPYIHPKLANIEMNARVTTHEASLDDLE